MSRVGKQELNIPAGVTVSQTSGVITVVGPKGTLTKPMRDEIVVTIEADKVTLKPQNLDTKFMNSLWGTYASHIKNMIKGVTNHTQRFSSSKVSVSNQKSKATVWISLSVSLILLTSQFRKASLLLQSKTTSLLSVSTKSLLVSSQQRFVQ